MKNPGPIEPKNLAAQLEFRAIGNPPSTQPSGAISNCFPGLEMDFRNVWRHILEGIVLHESDNLVVDLDPPASRKLKAILGWSLISVDGESLTVPVTGPRGKRQTKSVTLSSNFALEWSNALATVIQKPGQRVRCIFANPSGRKKITLSLRVRPFFDTDFDSAGNQIRKRTVIDRALAAPGDLTQSLCSPWQNDYLECACYYWAASRPDYVQIQPGPDGTSTGYNWLQKDRNSDQPGRYLSDDDDEQQQLLDYNDLFSEWERHLRFIIGGKDEQLGHHRPAKKPTEKKQKKK